MDTEQQQSVRLDPDILLEVQSEQIRVLTDQNIQLGAYIRQLKRDLEAAHSAEDKEPA